MATTRARIGEQGNGLPDVGELIYHHDQDTLYRVLRYSGIHTDGHQGNYVYADVVHDDRVLLEREYDCLRPLLVELLSDDEADADDMGMVAIGDQALAGDQAALDEVARVRDDARTRALYEALDLAELRAARRFPGQG